MEVRGRQPGGADEAQQRFREAQAELSSANRARVLRARQVLQTLSARRLESQRHASREAAEALRSKGEDAIRGQGKAKSDGAAVERSKHATAAEEAQSKERSEENRAQITAPTHKQDRLELSEAARSVAGIDDPARAERVRELAFAHQEGRFNTPERIDAAAERLLGG